MYYHHYAADLIRQNADDPGVGKTSSSDRSRHDPYQAFMDENSCSDERTACMAFRGNKQSDHWSGGVGEPRALPVFEEDAAPAFHHTLIRYGILKDPASWFWIREPVSLRLRSVVQRLLRYERRLCRYRMTINPSTRNSHGQREYVQTRAGEEGSEQPFPQ